MTEKKYKAVEVLDVASGMADLGQETPLVTPSITSRLNFSKKKGYIELPNIYEQTKTFVGHTVENVPSSAKIGSYDFVFVMDSSSNDAKVYRSSGGGSFSVIYTFTSSGDEAVYIWAVESRLCVVYWDTTASSLKLAYSDDLGVSWTITNWSGLYVIDHVLVSGRSYVLNKDGEVFASVDGANYTKIFDPKKDQRLNSLTEFDGKVFFAGNTSRSAFFGYFDEADQLVILRTYSTGAPYLLGFQSGITTVGDFLYFGFIQKGEFSLVRYDLDTARTILRFPGYTYVFFLNSTDEKGYFSLKSSSSNDFRYLFSISENGGVHYIADFGAYDVVCGFIRSNKYALLLASHAPYGNVTLWELNEDSYPLEATFRTEWLTLGEHVPIGLIFDFGDVGLVSTPHLPNIKVDISYDSLGSPQETVDVGAVNVARAIRLDPTADLDSPENCAMEYTMAFVPLSRDDKVRPFSVSFYFHLYSDDDTQERCPKLKGMKYVYEPVGMMSLI